MDELFQHTFKALRHELGHDCPRDTRPMWQRRLSTESVFCQSLVSCGFMTEVQMQRAAQLYRLGMSRDGGVIFWQIDENDVMRDGKIMYYRKDCHRDHDRKPSWVCYLLRRAGMLPEDFKSDHCLFGLHLLKTLPLPLPIGRGVDATSADNTEGNSNYAPPSQGGVGGGSAGSSVCVVESEKTAVIMSVLKPDYIWLATGGKTELNVAKLKPLQGRRVILFPDTDDTGQTYRDWYEIAEAASDVFGHPVTVSSILEQRATKAQRAAKIDIADLLFPSEKYGV